MPAPILGKDNKARQVAYRRLSRTALDKETVNEIRLALGQNQPLGNSPFYAKIEAMTASDGSLARKFHP